MGVLTCIHPDLHPPTGVGMTDQELGVKSIRDCMA